MSRYIDADKIRYREMQNEVGFGWYTSREHINGLPSEDVEPVRHGHWILTQKISENAFRYNCSECNRWVQDGAEKNPSDRYLYCHCGAKMDGKKKNETPI